MKICNATGNGICINCDHKPPTINGHSYGDVCRKDAEKVLVALGNWSMVCYNSDDGKFYEKIMYVHPACYMDDEWEEI